MKIGVLTSSRADFGIYLPLLNELKKDRYFSLSLIVFGSHLSKKHGYTINEILENGFEAEFLVKSNLISGSPSQISKTVSETYKQFSQFWSLNQNKFDLILCLGDRYEMFAAVTSAIPFGIKFGHIHGGETTLGAIDNIYRHCITLSSYIHFTAANEFSKKVKSIIGDNKNVFTVGSLSLDGLKHINYLSAQDFFDKWKVDLNYPSILVTVHPETVAFYDVEKHSQVLLQTLTELSKDYQIIITLPNADTYGMVIRNMIQQNLQNKKNIFVFESLGKQSYFTAMKLCSFMLGNTSSGIIEAASFKKYVINLGDRQKGRLTSSNVFNAAFCYDEIIEKVNLIQEKRYKYLGKNKYFKNKVAENIIQLLKNISFEK